MVGSGFERMFEPCTRAAQAVGKVKGFRVPQFQQSRQPLMEWWETREWGSCGKEKSYTALLTSH